MRTRNNINEEVLESNVSVSCIGEYKGWELNVARTGYRRQCSGWATQGSELIHAPRISGRGAKQAVITYLQSRIDSRITCLNCGHEDECFVDGRCIAIVSASFVDIRHCGCRCERKVYR